MTENKRYVEINNELWHYIKDNETTIKYDLNEVVDLLNEQDKEIKRLKCINRQLEERLDKSVALDMSKCGDVE